MGVLFGDTGKKNLLHICTPLTSAKARLAPSCVNEFFTLHFLDTLTPSGTESVHCFGAYELRN